MDRRSQNEEANHFAMCLLMPERMVFDEFKKMFPKGIELTNEKNSIKKLSDKFQVTDTMMWLRLGQLKLVR